MAHHFANQNFVTVDIYLFVPDYYDKIGLVLCILHSCKTYSISSIWICIKFDIVKWIMIRDFILPSGTSSSSCVYYLWDNN